MLLIHPETFLKSFCIYELVDQATLKRVFVWNCKSTEVLSIARAMSNPGFNPRKLYALNILQWFSTHRDAQNGLHKIIVNEGMPELNKSVRWNRYGSIKCNETGQIFRNQSDAARQLGINQSRLSQHMQRAAGYKSLKGMTFSYTNPLDDSGKFVNPVHYPKK